MLTISLIDLITQEANSQGVPPSLALAVAQQESGMNPSATGQSGEIGLFQLLPSSFPGFSTSDLRDVNTNTNLGIGYLADLYDQFGDWATALAAYNAGPGNVSKGIIPASTQTYVSNILSNANLSGDDSDGDDSDFLPGDLAVSSDAGSPVPGWAALALVGTVGIIAALSWS